MKTIPIVNEKDEVTHYVNSSERDINKEIMRVSVLWIYNEKKELLVCLRSKNKKSFANLWGESVSGTNEKDETYRSNIIKETREELGIDVENLSEGKKERLSIGHEFFCQWFFAEVSSQTKFTLQESEVDEVKWIGVKELKDWYQKSPGNFVPEFSDSIKIFETYATQN